MKTSQTNYWSGQMHGWTQERRYRQSLAIRRWRPWEESTGPRSAAGKRQSSSNSFKHGARSRAVRDIAALLAKLS
jgi:hypothetical protein